VCEKPAFIGKYIRSEEYTVETNDLPVINGKFLRRKRKWETRI